MANNDYLQLLGDKWQGEVSSARSAVKDLVSDILKANTEMRAMEGKLAISGKYSEAVQFTKQLDTAQKALQQTTEQAAKKTTELQLAVAEYNKILTATAQAQAKSAALSSDSAKALAEEKVALTENSRALMEEARAQNAAYQARQAAIAQRKAEQEEIRRQAMEERELQRLIKEEEKSNRTEQIRQQRAEERALAQERREYAAWWKQALKEKEVADRGAAQAELQERAMVAELQNEYKQLSLAYTDAALKAKNYALTLGTNHPITQQAQKDALAMADTLKRLDAAVGQHGRNVGNYNGAVAGFKMQVTQLAREIPSMAAGLSTFALAIGNNFPLAQEAFVRLREENAKLRAEGQKTVPIWKTLASSIFNWQTAIIVVLTVLPGLIKYLQQGSKATQEAEKANKKYADSLKAIDDRATESAAKDAARVRMLQAVIEDESQSRKKRNAAVDELQRLYPSVLANYSNEAILAGKASAEIDKLTKSIYQKAVADAYAEKYAAATVRADELKKALSGAAKAANDADIALDKALINTEKMGPSRRENDPNAMRLARLGSAAQDADKALKSVSASYSDALTQQQYFLEKGKQALSEIDDLLVRPEQTKAARTQASRTQADTYSPKDYTEELAAEKAKQRQIEAESNKAISEDESQALLARINALRAYTQEAQQAVTKRLEGELQETANSLGRIGDIEKKAADKRTNAEKDLLLQRAVLEARMSRIVAEESYERAKIRTEAANKEMDIVRKFYKDYTNAAKIAEQFLADFEAEGKNKRRTSRIDQQQLQKDLDIFRKYQDAANELAQISGMQSDARIRQLDAESEAVARRYDLEVEKIQNSLLSEQEKSARISELRERQFQEEQVLEGRRKAEKIKQAQFEKDMAIANIIINTAVAVVGYLAKQDYAEAIAAGFLGASQLAVAAATPIPQYATGTENHPKDGPAIVGDGGRSEYVVGPDGTISKTPATPTLIHLKKGSKVIPSETELIARYGADVTANRQLLTVQSDNGLRDALERQTKALSTAFSRQRAINLRIESDARRRMRTRRL